MRERCLIIAVALWSCGEVAGTSPDGSPGQLTVLATSPMNEGAAIAINTKISLELSAPVAPATVTSESLIVTGAGRPIAGEIAVDGATITFTPASSLHLLGTYDVELTTAVLGADGSALAAAHRFSFTTIEGTWSARTDLAADVYSFPSIAASRRGDILIAYNSTTATRDIKVVMRVANQPSFGVPENVENDETLFGAPRAALDESGNAIVAWTVPASPIARGWVRRTGGTWGTSTVMSGPLGALALASDGTALMALSDGGVKIATLPPAGVVWTGLVEAFPVTGTPSSVDATSTWGVQSAGDTLQIIADVGSIGQLRARSYTAAAGLGAPQNLTGQGVDANYVSFSQLPDDDLAFTWWQNGTELWSSRYDHATTTWAQAERISASGSGGKLCANPSGARIAAFSSSGSMFGAVAPAGQPFGTPINLGPATGLEYASCAIDDWGNGHLMWAGYGTAKTFHSRVKAGVPAPATELDDGPGLMDLFQDPVTGHVRVVFIDGNQDKLQLRTWQ